MHLRSRTINQVMQVIGGTDYLEIGVGDGDCFREVKARRKVGIDINPAPIGFVGEFHRSTSDDFFLTGQGRRFDCIFVDGLHLAEQAARDIANSLSILNSGGVVLVHDVLPRSAVEASREPNNGRWCGDVWRTMTAVCDMWPSAVTINHGTGMGVIPACTIGIHELIARLENIPGDFDGFFPLDIRPMGIDGVMEHLRCLTEHRTNHVA